MVYRTIPQRLEHLRQRAALECGRRSRPKPEQAPRLSENFIQRLKMERANIIAQLEILERRKRVLDETIALYEK